MENKQFVAYMKWCHDQYIFINPVPIDNYENYRIEVMVRGKQNIGSKIYTKAKDKEHPVFQRIRELYQEYYEIGSAKTLTA